MWYVETLSKFKIICLVKNKLYQVQLEKFRLITTSLYVDLSKHKLFKN